MYARVIHGKIADLAEAKRGLDVDFPRIKGLPVSWAPTS